jgi:hypothetical protein
MIQLLQEDEFKLFNILIDLIHIPLLLLHILLVYALQTY